MGPTLPLNPWLISCSFLVVKGATDSFEDTISLYVAAVSSLISILPSLDLGNCNGSFCYDCYLGENTFRSCLKYGYTIVDIVISYKKLLY